VANHQGILHRIAAVYADDPAEREDLMQDMLVQLWGAWSSFRAESALSTWMYRVALNTALLDRRRKSRRPILRPLSDLDTLRAVAPVPDESETDIRNLYACIRGLPELDRALILLQLEQHDYEQIAAITGLTRSNVSVRLVRIRRRLRRCLEDSDA
jgi:RNA polymerase sigma-70 factor (ECF subfamily)